MNLLIVDDDPSVVQLFQDAAEMVEGTQVDVAYSAEDAMGVALAGEHDMITLDIRMPGASGLDILGLLRNLRPHAIVAVISGHISPEDAVAAAVNADVVMGKPARMVSFVRLVECAHMVRTALDEVRTMGQTVSDDP